MVVGALRESSGAVLIDLHVRPRAKATRIVGYDEQRHVLRVDVAAPAERGKANRELLAYLAGVVGGPVVLARGVSSRRKTVSVRGMTRSDLAAALTRAMGTVSGCDS